MSLRLFSAITRVWEETQSWHACEQEEATPARARGHCFHGVLNITGAWLTWAAGAPPTGGELLARAVLRGSIRSSHSPSTHAIVRLALYCLLENKVWGFWGCLWGQSSDQSQHNGLQTHQRGLMQHLSGGRAALTSLCQLGCVHSLLF